MIKILIHELTHIKQVVKGELKPSKDYKELLWKGKPYISVKDYNKFGRKNYKDYNKLAWEKEADENANKLYKPFLSSTEWKSLKGKDDNLDFIMNNI